MPKPSQQRINAAPGGRLSPLSNPQESRVIASPVGSAVQVTRPDGLGGLIDGLSSLQPGLQRYAAITSKENNDADTQAGSVARERGDTNDQSKSASWINGYMKMDGYVRAGEDASAFREAYVTDFNQDTDDFDQWSRKWWGQRAKGVETEPAFLSGYQAPMINSIENLRAEHQKGVVETVQVQQRTNALSILDSSFKGLTAKGGVLTSAHVDQQRKALQSAYNISNKDYNALVFESLLPIATSGRPHVLEALKQNRPDGTPGMYFIPEWKDKIDNAMAEGYRKSAENAKLADTVAEKQRLQAQSDVVFPTLLTAEAGEVSPEAARDTLIVAMRQNPHLFHADEVAAQLGRIRTGGNAAQDSRQQSNASLLLTSIHTGKAGSHEVMQAAQEGSISYAQQQQLLQDVAAVEKMRKEKGEEFDVDRRNRAGRMNDFNLEKILMESMDRGPRGMFDSADTNAAYYERLKATGMAALNRLVFTSDITDVIGLTEETRKIGAALVGQQAKIAKEPDARKKDELSKAMPAFQSMADLSRAVKAQQLPPEVRAHNIREMVRARGLDPALPPPKAPPKPAVDVRPLQPPKAPAAPLPQPKAAPKAPAAVPPTPTEKPPTAPKPILPAPAISPEVKGQAAPAALTPAQKSGQAPSEWSWLFRKPGDPVPENPPEPREWAWLFDNANAAAVKPNAPAASAPKAQAAPAAQADKPKAKVSAQERKKLLSEITQYKAIGTDAKRSTAERDTGIREMVSRALKLGISRETIEQSIRRPLSSIGF